MDIKHLKGVAERLGNLSFINVMFMFSLLSSLGFTFVPSTLHAAEEASFAAIEGTPFDSFELIDDIAFPAPKKIYIEKVQASFSKVWMRKFRSKTGRRYRAKTLQKYADTFRKNLAEKFASTGWIVLNAPENGAMTINATLLNLHINGPSVLNIVQPLVLNIGTSGLELTIHDADNRLAVRIEDMRVARSLNGAFIETNEATNFVRFNKVFYVWANDLTVLLNIMSEL